MSEYRVILTASALRSLESVPPRVVEPLVAFIFGTTADEPKRRGKPLQRELEGRWSARRGDFRVVYRIDDDTMTIYVLKVGHRGRIYGG